MPRHPECPDVHLGECPKCKRLYGRDRLERSSAVERRPVKSQVEGSSPSAPAKSSGPTDKAKAGEVVSDAGEKSDEPRPLQPSRGGERVVETPKALTPAQKQKRYRERHGDEYRKREAERQKRRRARLKK